MSNLLDEPCVKCGESIRRLMILAMMVDCGARCYPHPLHCAGGGEHDFAPRKIDNHDSDCATHNEPAYPNGSCDCGASTQELNHE